MQLKDILDRAELIMRVNDILYFCEDIDTIKEYVELTKATEIDINLVKEFIIEHEDKIDIEKLLLVLIKNYEENRESVKIVVSNNNNILMRELEKLDERKAQERSVAVKALKSELNRLEKILKELKKIGKGMNKTLVENFYDEEKGVYRAKIIDSRKIISEKTPDKPDNLKRFEEIDKEFRSRSEDKKLGIEYLLQVIFLTDLSEVYPDSQFGDKMRELLVDNNLLKEGRMNHEEIEKIKIENYNEYGKLVNKKNTSKMLTDIKDNLREYIEYVDIDKLLMLSAWRFQNILENKPISPDLYEPTKEIMEVIYKSIKKHKGPYKYELEEEVEKDKYILREITFSVKDIKDCIRRFTKDSYLTKSNIEKYNTEIDLGEKDLLDLDSDIINIIFSNDDLEKKAGLSDRNIQYAVQNLDWEKEKIVKAIENIGSCSTELLNDLIKRNYVFDSEIIQMYMQKIINIEQIAQIKDRVGLYESVEPSKLIKYYEESNKDKATDEEKEEYKRYLELYKEILTKGNSKKLEDIASELMEQMVEDYDAENPESHMRQMKEYYKEGVLTLDSILEWNDENVKEDFMTDLYNQGKISLDKIVDLIKKSEIELEYIKKLVFNLNISDTSRMQILELGWISVEELLQLFSEGIIYEKDLYKLSEKRIISNEDVHEIIEESKFINSENDSCIKLRIGDDLQKLKRDNNIYSSKNEGNFSKSKTRYIIDPNERIEYLNLLRAYKVPDEEIDINPNSPFYNYDFFIITDKKGRIGGNSVVIAERIYEEKQYEVNVEEVEKTNKRKSGFATENATYFFKFKDLMPLTNYLKKGETLKEGKNIIFKSNHTVATNERDGYWARSILYNIAKNLFSSDLKEYSKKNQKIIVFQKLSELYSNDELSIILDKAKEIDTGNHTCEILKYGKIKKLMEDEEKSYFR